MSILETAGLRQQIRQSILHLKTGKAAASITLGAILSSLIFTQACGNFELNSSRSNLGETSPASAEFLTAQTILTNQCANCHSYPSHASFATYTEADWIKNGFVIPGSPSTSPLLLKLQTYGGTMPLASQISRADTEALEAWVNSTLTNQTGTNDNGALLAMRALNSSCVSCHTTVQVGTLGNVPAFGSIVQNYVAGKTDLATLNQYFVQNDLILQGNSNDSWIYKSLATYGSIGTMPQDQAISTTSANSIANWINHIGD